MKNQPKILLFGTSVAVAAVLLSPGQGMGQTVGLSNDGSSVSVNLSGANSGMNWWNVPGSSQNQLDQQWFYYSINGGLVQSIDTLAGGALTYNPSGGNNTYNQDGGNDTLSVIYANAQLSISLEYVLQGTGMGSASITESIAVDNNTGAPFNLNLFEYSNFNLLQSDNNTATVYADTVTGPGYNYASQTSGATAIQQGISSPDATYAEAGPSGTVLSDVTSGSNLNGPLTSGPGDVAWAFQWNTTVAAQPDEFDELGSGSLSITNVPEPSTFALIGLGLGALGWMRRRPLA